VASPGTASFPLTVPSAPVGRCPQWHLGHANESRLPVHRGFQHSLGYLTGQEDYYCRTVGASCPNVTATSANPAQHRGARPGKCPSPSFGTWLSEIGVGASFSFQALPALPEASRF